MAVLKAGSRMLIQPRLRHQRRRPCPWVRGHFVKGIGQPNDMLCRKRPCKLTRLKSFVRGVPYLTRPKSHSVYVNIYPVTKLEEKV